MLFRRVAEHVRAQNWVAVLLDLLIVIVGIFIGLQVNDWNEARLDIKREAVILDRLRADFEVIRSEAESATGEHIRSVANLLVVLESTVAGEVTDEQSFREGLESALKFSPSARRSATWVDIVSSGQTALLRDPELRSALSRYDELHQGARSLFAQFWEGQRVHEVSFHRHFEYEIGRNRYDDRIFFDGDVATYDIAAMAADPEFRRATQRLIEYQSYYQFWHMRMGNAADDVLELL